LPGGFDSGRSGILDKLHHRLNALTQPCKSRFLQSIVKAAGRHGVKSRRFGKFRPGRSTTRQAALIDAICHKRSRCTGLEILRKRKMLRAALERRDCSETSVESYQPQTRRARKPPVKTQFPHLISRGKKRANRPRSTSRSSRPECFTIADCCYFSFDYRNFLLEQSNSTVEYLSLELMQTQCYCPRVMDNPNRVDPPPSLEKRPLVFVVLPYCIN
jgi:hypothetical protein